MYKYLLNIFFFVNNEPLRDPFLSKDSEAQSTFFAVNFDPLPVSPLNKIGVAKSRFGPPKHSMMPKILFFWRASSSIAIAVMLKHVTLHLAAK